MNGLGLSQSLPDQIEMTLWGGYPPRGLVLKRVEDVQHAFETHGVNGAVRVSVVVIANLNDAAAEAPRLPWKAATRPSEGGQPVHPGHACDLC